MSVPEPQKAKLSEEEAKAALQSSKTFSVLFTRAPFFRTVQADGSWGRISPSNLIHLSFFNDCGPLPAVATHEILPDGKLSEDLRLTLPVETNLIRQIEVDVVLSLETAKLVRNNLENFIRILEDMKKEELKKSSQP